MEATHCFTALIFREASLPETLLLMTLMCLLYSLWQGFLRIIIIMM